MNEFVVYHQPFKVALFEWFIVLVKTLLNNSCNQSNGINNSQDVSLE